MKKILIMGGTQFIGRVLTEKLEKTGYNITLFNRGKKNPGLFHQYRNLTGDRETGDIKQIFKEDWDTVIDMSAYYPLSLEKLVKGLDGKIGRYIFVSTISVFDLGKYRDRSINEDTETLPCSEAEKVSDDLRTYGQRKAECERILLANEWLDSVIFRPSVVYGKYDYTDRFYYWLYRVMKGKQILVPKDNSKGNYTFVDDLADLMIEAIAMARHSKVYNAATHDPVSVKEIIKTAAGVSGKEPELVYATPGFLKNNEVQPWSDLPLWVNANMVIDYSRIKKDFKFGLTSFADSVRKTSEYYNSLGWTTCKSGLSLKKEKELIAKLEVKK
jgi:2'-hydroxyisoflavone reductase